MLRRGMSTIPHAASPIEKLEISNFAERIFCMRMRVGFIAISPFKQIILYYVRTSNKIV